MARITMEVVPHVNTDPEAVQEWVACGLALEQDSQPGAQVSEDAETRTGPSFTMAATNLPPGTELPPAAPRKTVGRRTVAQRAAEREAAEAASQQPAQEQQPQQVEQASVPASGQASIPPGVQSLASGIAPPGAQGNGAVPPGVSITTGPQATAPQPIPAAMPKSEPLPPAVDGMMRLEEFRAANMEIQKFKPGKMSLLMRAGLWPSDNSAKGSWYTMEAVPPECRARLVDEVQYMV